MMLQSNQDDDEEDYDEDDWWESSICEATRGIFIVISNRPYSFYRYSSALQIMAFQPIVILFSYTQCEIKL